VTRPVTSARDTAEVTNYSPFTAARQKPTRIELSKLLWTMRSAVGREITAAIYTVATGRELRVVLGQDLLESLLSRSDDGALETRAAEIKALISTKGWRDAD
jgi:hypothetical protein